MFDSGPYIRGFCIRPYHACCSVRLNDLAWFRKLISQAVILAGWTSEMAVRQLCVVCGTYLNWWVWDDSTLVMESLCCLVSGVSCACAVDSMLSRTLRWMNLEAQHYTVNRCRINMRREERLWPTINWSTARFLTRCDLIIKNTSLGL